MNSLVNVGFKKECKFRLAKTNVLFAFLLQIPLSLNVAAEGVEISGSLINSEIRRGEFLEPQPKTIITRTEIEKSGARTLVDILRQVPGLIIDPISGNEFRINYLGGPSYLSRRLQVLVDGVSYFLPNLARVKLNQIPISIEDIERVEFVHGPSTALYQENAFSGTLNIITQDPRDSDQLNSKVTVGSQDTESLYLQWALNPSFNSSHRTSVNVYNDDGFDRSDFTETAHDSTQGFRAYHKSFFQIDDKTEVEIFGSYFSGELDKERDNSEQSSLPDRKQKNISFAFDFTKLFGVNHIIDISASHLKYERESRYKIRVPTFFLTPAANFLVENTPYLAYDVFVYQTTPISALSDEELLLIAPGLAELEKYGLSQTEGDLDNQTTLEQTTDIELAYRYLDGNTQIDASIGVKHKLIDNPFNYFGQRYYLRDYRQSVNVRRIFFEDISVNVGFLNEQLDISSGSFSPRASAVYRINPNNFLRVSAANAKRNPNLYEMMHDSKMLLVNLEPDFEGLDQIIVPLGLRGNPNLESEELDSFGVSYTYNNGAHMLETRLFYNEYDRLISETLSDDSFSKSTNNSEAIRKGLGIEYKFASDYLYTRLGYAYQNSDATSERELEMDFKHTGSVRVGILKRDYQVNIGYSGHNVGFTGSYDQFDAGLVYSKNNFTVAYNIHYWPSRKFNDFEEPIGGVRTLSGPVYFESATSHFVTFGYKIP